jgi:hypothetical protein
MKECMGEDKDHPLECGNLIEMVFMSDITRIMTRLLLKVEKWGQEHI